MHVNACIKTKMFVGSVSDCLLVYSSANEFMSPSFKQQIPSSLKSVILMQVDVTIAEEGLQKEVGAVRCVQGSFF